MGRKILGATATQFTTAFIIAYTVWFIIIETLLIASNLMMGRSLEGTITTSGILSLVMVTINAILYKRELQ